MESIVEVLDRVTTSTSPLATATTSDMDTDLVKSIGAADGSVAALEPQPALMSLHDTLPEVFHSTSDLRGGHDHKATSSATWHNHGSLLLLLVFIHLLAFFYWMYAYLKNRKFETVKSETARKAVKNFKVVYEWSVLTTKELTSAVRKKRPQAIHNYGAPQRMSVPSQGRPAIRRSNSGYHLDNLIKGPAP